LDTSISPCVAASNDTADSACSRPRGRSIAMVSFHPPSASYTVEPTKRWADLIVPEGGDNHVALDVLLGRLGRIAFG
jgi:hypothetical protein